MGAFGIPSSVFEPKLYLCCMLNFLHNTQFLPVEHRSNNRVFKISSTILKPAPPTTPKARL